MQDIKKKFWLEKFDCFSITGKDARKFLNGITTGNILDSENKVIKTCWLTPNGVLRSLIEIIFLERNLEVIILAGNTNEIIDYFNQIIFPADDVLLSEPYLINRIQKIDESSSWRTSQPIFFKKEDKEFEMYKNNLNFSDQEIDSLTSRFIDLHTLVRKSWILPLKNYGLKTVSNWLGFEWLQKNASGSKALYWWIQYQITENQVFLKKIIQYNKDDCFATLQIAKYLIKNRLKKN